MSKKALRPPAHRAPKDLKLAISKSSKAVQEAWEDITPLARSEFSCWVMSAKKEETRERRIRVGIDKLAKGERRPCCWPGCPHR